MASEKVIIPIVLTAGLVLFFSQSQAEETVNITLSAKPSDFIKKNFSLAKQTEKLYAVPALFTISQAGVESGWGKSNLAQKASNYFGIKADSKWYGPVYNGYRKYNSVQESFNDQAKFLTTNKRYDKAFNSNDPYAFMRAVAAAGYAKNPAYSSILTKTMDAVSNLV